MKNLALTSSSLTHPFANSNHLNFLLKKRTQQQTQKYYMGGSGANIYKDLDQS
jgi:hypothetical protein